jgi:glycosyltransferase involved in cell wall biosynthesis
MSSPDRLPLVSLVVLCRNEERTIASCLDSLLAQDCAGVDLEILVADGMSEDGTRLVVEELGRRSPVIRLIDNPGKTAPCAFNIGTKAALGSRVIIMGAHTTYPPGYVRLCIETSQRTGADLVGGCMVTMTRGEGFAGRLVQALTTHRFGVGGAEFRLGAKEGPADTVPYGCYRREVFDRIGWFDERLTRNQDYEFSRRILAAGGKIWCNPAIRTKYYSRATLGGLFKQAFGTGKWNPWMWFVAPYSFAPRHLVPGLFVAGMFLVSGFWFLVTWGWILLAAILVPYFSLSLFASVQQARRLGSHPRSSFSPQSSLLHPPPSVLTPHSSFLLFLPLPFLFFTYHVSYGLGTLWGAIRLLVGATPVQKIREPWPGAGRYRAYQGRSQRSRAKSQESKPPKP